MRSFALTPSLSANSLTVTPSVSATLPVGFLNSRTFPETGAACLRVSRRADGVLGFSISSSVGSGKTMSGPISSAMICVPENGPLVKSSASTSTSRVFFTPLPAGFFFSGRSSSSDVFLRRAVGAPGMTGGGIGIGRPTPAGRRPPPALRIAAPGGRVPIGRAPIGRAPVAGRAPIAGRAAIGGRSPCGRPIGGRTAGAWPA